VSILFLTPSSSLGRSRTASATLSFVAFLSLCAAVLWAALPASAQLPAIAGGQPDRGRILLVQPFENRSSQPNLEWIREAAPDLLTARFASAGFAPMSRADRLYAFDHLGLPMGFHPSRASSLKLAQTLDADSIIVGSFQTEGSTFVAEAQIVDVPHLRMSEAVTARGDLHDLINVFDSLAWKLTRQLDPNFNGAEETFIAAGSTLKINAFEQYIRGISESDQAERQQHLNQAVKLSPNYSQAWQALGREFYTSQQYDKAADAFAKIDRNDSAYLEASFYRGVALIFSGDYPAAADAFAAVARTLPLAVVLNNEGVSLARQDKDATELFRKAIEADPNGADYHFNLAVNLKHHGNDAEALKEIEQALHLRPADTEAEALLRQWKAPANSSDLHIDPLERLERSFDAAAFRQAELMLDQVESLKMSALSPRERATRLAAQGRENLDRSLLLEAERLYLSAIEADTTVAAAHSGLAEVRERTGDTEAAKREARIALRLTPSSEAHLVLGRIAYAAGQRDEASTEAAEALRLAPHSFAAQQLDRQLHGGTLTPASDAPSAVPTPVPALQQ